jgi:hypothetical protein
MDGYAAHFDEFALNLLRNAHVYIIFLRAQNSENDQPNDNGLNAILKRCYDVCYATWKGETSAHTVMTFRPCFFNLMAGCKNENCENKHSNENIIKYISYEGPI